MAYLQEKVRVFINKTHMLNPYDSVVVGLSGGADSVCLLNVLLSLRQEYNLELYAVHIHHGIRGDEADGDEDFARRLCEKLEVSYSCYKYSVPELAVKWHMTLEEAARKVRYEAFLAECEKVGAAKIAIAHHMDDQAETILFRMSRGTGIKGLTGMSAVRDNIIRPLLCVSRKEIVTYLEQTGTSYINDSTNSCVDYDRNRIRHNVMPELTRINEAAAKHITDMAMRLECVYDYLKMSADEFVIKNVSFGEGYAQVNAQALGNCHAAVKKEAVRCMIMGLTDTLKDVTAEHIETVLSYVDMETGKESHLPYGMTVVREYDVIRIEKKAENYAEIDECYIEDVLKWGKGICFKDIYLPDEGVCAKEISVSFSTWLNESDRINIPNLNCTKWFDYDRIKGNLCIRQASVSDYFVMKNGNKKKLSRYMIDKKVPRRYRDRILVVADECEVLWIVGGRRSDRAFVLPETKSILKVQCTREENRYERISQNYDF